MKKLPALQFYPGDWMKDPAVRSLTVAARGVWIDMLCLMHEANDRGYLRHNAGSPMTVAQLARVVGVSQRQMQTLIGELETAGVFSRSEDGAIYSRRMARDEAKRRLCSEAGSEGGGNPNFKGQTKGDSNGQTKGDSKQNDGSSVRTHASAHAEVETEEEDSTSQSNERPESEPMMSSASPTDVWAVVERIESKVDASGLSLPPSRQILRSWVADFGEELILETLEDCGPAYQGKPFQYFEKILANRHANPHERPGARRKGVKTEPKSGLADSDRRALSVGKPEVPDTDVDRARNYVAKNGRLKFCDTEAQRIEWEAGFQTAVGMTYAEFKASQEVTA